jgi:hypothetical protein
MGHDSQKQRAKLTNDTFGDDDEQTASLARPARLIARWCQLTRMHRSCISPVAPPTLEYNEHVPLHVRPVVDRCVRTALYTGTATGFLVGVLAAAMRTRWPVRVVRARAHLVQNATRMRMIANGVAVYVLVNLNVTMWTFMACTRGVSDEVQASSTVLGQVCAMPFTLALICSNPD